MENVGNEPVVSSEIVDTPIAEQAVNTENAEPSAEIVETKAEKTFTQSELDAIIQKRIDRERESVTKKAAQEARDAYFAEQNIEWQGKKITTESEYKQALKEKELIDKYSEQGLPDDVVQELVEGKKFRDQYNETQKKTADQAKQESDFHAFLETYPDVDPKDIPQTVWDDVSNGKSLVDAFVKHENQTLKQRLAEVEKSKQIEQQNIDNAQASTGAVTNTGGNPAYFTREQVAKMSISETNRNWTAINESMKKWK
ncbi:hypothetical protein BK133_00815 [Paenibacillus sp. FSL H8-0548]|uniref:hypothetical protein n=1 Tax=Paenibacillus sp. FSL H8-0548 TaxID=1920422 RepID=UPI00096D53EF|nr:hypothetical protein [Paenibacillus sp. FSL H8-0548]OMF38778.1 hypothetical protein BK133_00815 [Paenibacillus sp. FSL H8-0548]